MPTEPESKDRAIGSEPEWIALVRSMVQGLRYGVVQLVIHDGRVIQIERTEKTRLASGPDVLPRAG